MAMIRHSSRMDRPGEREGNTNIADVKSVEGHFSLVFVLTMEHISLGVGKTQSAGLQQVCRSDGGFGCRHTTQTQHLEINSKESNCRYFTWRFKHLEPKWQMKFV